MKFTFACKKVSLNDSVKAYAEKKVGKLEKFFHEEPEASVTFAVEKKNRCVVEVMLRGQSGTLFRAVCEDADG
ncbi:MAG: HPF/RaiA family ribosome-associated protein, partial [Oscillospiraceae bacterium]|nr:HPF/RaiA family ribosome-associated protein [Oscillospiraceae bacterium]